MNAYARLSAMKGDVAGVSGATYDSTYLTTLDEVSREFESETSGRRIYSYWATKTFSVPRPTSDNNGGRSLYFNDDLLSVTTLKVDTDFDGVFETTLAANTDYTLFNGNDPSDPYDRIDIVPTSTLLGQWPWPRYGSTRQWSNCVQIVGLWGFSNETENTLQTVGDNPLLIGATLLTVQSTADIDPGETLVIESEQLYVVSVNDPTTLTVTRGINSSTAAQHAQSTVVYRRRYPRDIEQAVKQRAVFKRWNTQAGFAGAEILGGGVAGGDPSRNAVGQWFGTCKKYRRWWV